MKFIDAIKKARRKAKATGEPVYIMHDPPTPERPWESRYYPATDKDLTAKLDKADVNAIVTPDGRIEQ